MAARDVRAPAWLNMLRNGPGRLTVIVGPMFSGKTSTLIDRARSLARRGEVTAVFGPVVDSRPGGPWLLSHDGESARAEIIGCARKILDSIRENTRFVII